MYLLSFYQTDIYLFIIYIYNLYYIYNFLNNRPVYQIDWCAFGSSCNVKYTSVMLGIRPILLLVQSLQFK